jgi:microcystin-dependent protein
MKNQHTRKPLARVFAMALPALLMCASIGGAADANPPDRMSYQGYLVDSSGTALGNTAPKNYDVIFRIWSDQLLATTGYRIWSEQQTITVDKGYFSVLLGEGSSYSGEARPLLSSLFTNALNASDRFIDITVKGIGTGGTDSAILPRVRLLSSPYAFLARNSIYAGNAVTAAYAVNSGNASNLVNGANASVVAVSGSTVTVAGGVTMSGSISGVNATLSGNISGVNATLSGSVTGGVITATSAFVGNGTIPVGGIIMWSGTNVPSGWALCNGSTVNGQVTPNLSGRFVLGATNTAALAAVMTGGASSVTLNTNQIPSHAHPYKDGYYAEGYSAGNIFSGGGSDYMGQSVTASGNNDNDNNWVYWRPMTTANNSTTGAAVPILPPYYVLAYIMRVQ